LYLKTGRRGEIFHSALQKRKKRCDSPPVSGALRERFGESGRAFRDVFTNPNLRRVELAWAGSVAGQWAYGIALAVFAYRHGGAAAVGLVGLIRTLPAAAAAPFAALLADRYRRERIMLVADLARTATIGAAGAAALGGVSPSIIYTLAGATSILATAFGPAEKALLPQLARTPEELTAANVASSTIESVGSFVGPALGGVLLATTSAGVVFLVTAGTFLWSGALVFGIRSGKREVAAEPAGFAREAAAGFRAIALERKLRVIVALYAAQTLVAGAVSVLVVVTALDLLDKNEATVGLFNAAAGVGGVLGAGVVLALVGRRRLAGDFGLGILLWGVPLTLIGVWPNTVVALVFLGILGIGNTLVDVSGLTLLQRTADDAVLARVFGVLESLLIGTIGLGAILAPLLIEVIGIRGALIATGAFLPVVAALFWRRLAEIDAGAQMPGPELDLLRSIPIFSPLGQPALERVTRQLIRVEFEAGTEIVRQGESGDRFYVIESGEVEVTQDGRVINRLGPGGYFGEIALLRDVPRTASVRAITDVTAFALERDDFLAAVTASPPSARAADAVVGARLGVSRATDGPHSADSHPN
jgi:cyclic nucleotide-binding protein/MFS transporter